MGTSKSGRYLNTKGSGRSVSDFALVHSSEGAFTRSQTRVNGEMVIKLRLNNGGHSQKGMELLDKYEMFQGGFIWTLIDQALYMTDEVTGNRVLRYGGDFDDRPSDYEFTSNGIVFANRMEKPAMQEVRYYYGKY